MEKQLVYHVLTDLPMTVGQHIVFDGTHHSGVYKRVMAEYETVRRIVENPDQYEPAALKHHTRVAIREPALEEVRCAYYLQYPSRLHCLYCSEAMEEALRWAEVFVAWKRPTYAIVELRATGGICIGDANNCFDATSNRELIRHWHIGIGSSCRMWREHHRSRSCWSMVQ